MVRRATGTILRRCWVPVPGPDQHQVRRCDLARPGPDTRKRFGAGLARGRSTPLRSAANGRGVILTFDPDSDGHATQHTTPAPRQCRPRHGGTATAALQGRSRTRAGIVAARSRSARFLLARGALGIAPDDTPPSDAADSSALGLGSLRLWSRPRPTATTRTHRQVANGQVPGTPSSSPRAQAAAAAARKPAAATAPSPPADAPGTQPTPSATPASRLPQPAPNSHDALLSSQPSPFPLILGAPEGTGGTVFDRRRRGPNHRRLPYPAAHDGAV